MVFTLRETVSGLRHLRLKWTRIIFNRPENYFLRDYPTAGFLVERYVDYTGKPAVCPVCGYACFRVRLTNGWSLETCSALPAIPPLGSAEFQQWIQTLPVSSVSELPFARV